MTIAILIYATVITMLLCYACERHGQLKQQSHATAAHATLLARWNLRLQADAERERAALREARAELDDSSVIIGWQGRQISGHIRDASLLRVGCGRGSAEDGLVAADIIGGIEEWLAGEGVTG